jgi:DNA-directed RNA polymerase subunit RPC12/RpoP
MLIFPCKVCNTQLSAEEQQVGQLVRCPTCSTTLTVPTPTRNENLVGAGIAGSAAGGGTALPPRKNFESLSGSAMGRSGGGRRYGFHCAYCSSRLEAQEGMAAQDGQCPTCGNTITIPILDRYGRLIDPKTRQIIKQDPHPVHAYAAAGDRAPRILRQPGGQLNIMCPRCNTISPITANNCKSCGMPFTMEGTTIEATGTNDSYCVASLVLGIIGIFASCTVITPLLALIFGIVGYNRVSKSGVDGSGKKMAIAGIICGIIGCLIGAYFIYRNGF